MPDLDLAAVEARAAAATEGPWVLNYTLGMSSWPIVVAEGIGLIADVAENGMSEADAAFIAHAKTDVPLLVLAVRERDILVAAAERIVREQDARIAALDEQLAAVRDLLRERRYRLRLNTSTETQRHAGAMEFAAEVLAVLESGS